MRVLILDNDRDILRSLEILLNKSDRNVVTFNDPRRAISYLQNHVVDILIVDYLMPEFTGTEFLEQVQGFLTPACRIVIISGYMERIDRESLSRLGVVGFIPKPLDLDKLCQLIETEKAV